MNPIPKSLIIIHLKFQFIGSGYNTTMSVKKYSFKSSTTTFLRLILTLLALGSISSSIAETTDVNAQELAEWAFWGQGSVTLDDSQKHVILEESKNSKGIILASPKSYKDVVVNYRVTPLTSTSVMVVMLATNDASNLDSTYRVADDYDGNMKTLTTENDSYFIAFNNSAHSSTPYITKYVDSTKNKLTSAETNLSSAEWYDVEVGKVKNNVWLKVNDKLILQTTDEQMLSSGHIVFRLRGTKNSIASAKIENLKITSTD